ncbi:B12-binding domain-containing radical SAM protein [Rhizobium johnstonii]|uniref:B12-binding domain-containing radical SAM protein n=1 Tax=Rhizobium johnstonii TaxID=3019933 RepID=UPI003F95B04F
MTNSMPPAGFPVDLLWLNEVTMDSSHWLLVFPPLIHSNWGSYYPSTALLGAALEAMGCCARQIDLNEAFLDHLVAPARLARLVAGADLEQPDSVESLPIRAAASLLLSRANAITDEWGRHLSSEQSVGLELATELARPYHVDFHVSALIEEAFDRSPVAYSYGAFFAKSGVDDAIRSTKHAVGISVPMGPQLAPALLLARRVKRLRPHLKVVVGGPVLTLMADELLKDLLNGVPEIDAVVRYDGEGPIQHLSAQLAAGAWTPGKIPNVHTRDRIKPQERTALRLRDVPIAKFSDNLLSRLAEPRLSVQQARGCYWGDCAYCDFIELHNTGRRYDAVSVGSLVEQVRRFTTEHGVRRFWLVTEALPPKIAEKFAQTLITEGLDVDWRSFAMVDPGFTPEVLSTLLQSGCSSLTIGMESMTTRVLQNVRKKADGDGNIAFLEATRRSMLKIDVNLIPDLPTTTAEEAMAGLAVLERYEDVFRMISIFPFEATRSSDIGRDPIRYGLEVVKGEPDPLHPNGQAQFSSNRLVCRDSAMTTDERARVFAAYRAFARRVGARRRTASLTAGRGFRFASLCTAILPSKDAVLVYDWDRDRAWRLPPQIGDLLRWMQERGRPVGRGEIATFLQRNMEASTATLPQVTNDLLSSLATLEVIAPSHSKVSL